MAALFRSARLLKYKPSCLVEITGTKSTGVSAGRLYSGAVGGRNPGVCPRQTFPVLNAPRYLLPCTTGLMRSYAVATERKEEASAAVRSKQAQQFDWALGKLDSSVRRTGRITKTLLLRIFHDICRTGYPSGNQALLLLRSCGSLLPEIPPADRTELAHHIWEKLQELGAQYDVSHYNALLKVYLQNEFKFSPMDFLAKMEAKNTHPNRVTYQRLIAAYCQNGDIEGASTILGFMKSKDLPITESVFNSLVTGHARAGDIESSKNILTVMRNAGIEPGPDTYVSLLNAYAQNGDMENVKATLEAAESADCSLMDRDLMQVIFTLAKAGHHQHTSELVERMRHERGYIPDAMNLCLSLITHGQEDTAFHILKSFPSLQLDNVSQDSLNLGSFFLRHCVTMETSLEKIGQYCKELQEANLHTSPLIFALSCALESKKTAMSIEMMKMLKDQKMPVRPHFFWPLLTAHVKDKNPTDLDVAPDVDTLSTYILPAFPSLEEAREALKDAGVSLESEGFLSSEVRSLALQDLAGLHTLLNDPSFSTPELMSFRGSLIMGFRKSSDMESMVKITQLLFQNESFYGENTKPSEAGGFFLYNLIESMPQKEVQEQEDKLRKYFSQLREQNITISANIYRGIRNVLEAQQVPELIKDVLALVDPKEKVFNGITKAPATETENKLMTLEKKLEELKNENKPLGSTLKQIFHFLAAEENLQRALELKQQHEDEMTIAAYAILINLCCRHDNVEEALNLKREMSRMDSSVALDANKYIALVKTLSKNGKVEEAVDILKEMKEKDVVLTDIHLTLLFHTLNSVVAKGGADVIRRLQDTIFTLGLAKPTANLCSPLVTAYLDSNDLSGALDAAIECHQRYKLLPRIHDIIVGLVQQGDTELLQKAMDFVSQERGEMTMLYDLFFAFLQTGRYREARKIIETPGLRARPGRLHWYAEKCISSNQMESLEQMVEMTSKLFECDRDEMYNYVLRLCKDTNDWQKAEAMWTKMQEENAWYDHSATTQKTKSASSAPASNSSVNDTDYNVKLLTLCKRGKSKVNLHLTAIGSLNILLYLELTHVSVLLPFTVEAYGMVKEINKNGVALGPATYDQLIRALLSEGAIEEALALKDIATSHIYSFKLSDIATNLLIITQSKKGQTEDALLSLKSMLQSDHVPSKLAVTRLVQTLGSHGNVGNIQEVETLMKGLNTPLNLSSMLFINNIALAHIKNDDLESVVEIMESVYQNPDSASLSMSFVFRKVLEDGNDKAFDKLSATAERLANHFACYRPAADIFIQLLDMDKVEDAKFMLARCNAVAEQKDILISFLSKKAQSPGQLGKIKNLMNLIPDFTEKKVLCSYLMKSHVMDNDLESAKALHEQMQKEGVEVDELSLKRLATLYRQAGETVPFPEPPESFKFYADKLKEKLSRAQTTEE
ncbi:hypothetical protein WMY93_018844 [Mugilogobius chulae]|uniref:Leucine-rich pentatricopeptide repeat containing n=1 Tax=Mugilogobius chulae TaxID=88201 RepID=A0AAW0NJZ9_9GOBI